MADYDVLIREEAQLPPDDVTLRSAYKEVENEDGSKHWVADLGDVDDWRVADGGPLRRALEETRQENALLRRNLPADYSAEQFKQDQEDLKRFREFTPEDAYKADVAEKMALKDKQISTMLDAYREKLLSSQAIKSGVLPLKADDHAALMARQVRVEFDSDGNIKETFLTPNGQPMVRTDDKAQDVPVTIDDLYADDKKREDRLDYYRNETRPGAGTTSTEKPTDQPADDKPEISGTSVVSSADLDKELEGMRARGLTTRF